MRYCDIYCAEEKYVSLFLTLFLCYTELLSTYWNIGKIIVEHEQGNNDRADYGKQTLKQLSKELRLNHKFCGISDSSRSSVGSYRIASERNIRHQDIRIPVCEES